MMQPGMHPNMMPSGMAMGHPGQVHVVVGGHGHGHGHGKHGKKHKKFKHKKFKMKKFF